MVTFAFNFNFLTTSVGINDKGFFDSKFLNVPFSKLLHRNSGEYVSRHVVVTGIEQHFVQILKNCLFQPLLHFHVMQCYSLPVVVLQNTHHFSAAQQNWQSSYRFQAEMVPRVGLSQ